MVFGMSKTSSKVDALMANLGQYGSGQFCPMLSKIVGYSSWHKVSVQRLLHFRAFTNAVLGLIGLIPCIIMSIWTSHSSSVPISAAVSATIAFLKLNMADMSTSTHHTSSRT